MNQIPPVPDGPWFNPVAAFLGEAYLRNAFTKGTEQEVDFLVETLALAPGMRVLDAGCGPGRHALATRAPRHRRGGHRPLARLRRAGTCRRATTFPSTSASATSATSARPMRSTRSSACARAGSVSWVGETTSSELSTSLRTRSAPAVAWRSPPSPPISSCATKRSARRSTPTPRSTTNAPPSADPTARSGPSTSGPLATRRVSSVSWQREPDCGSTRVYGVHPGRYARTAPQLDAPEHLLLATRSAAGVSPAGDDLYPWTAAPPERRCARAKPATQVTGGDTSLN